MTSPKIGYEQLAIGTGVFSLPIARIEAVNPQVNAVEDLKSICPALCKKRGQPCTSTVHRHYIATCDRHAGRSFTRRAGTPA